MAEASTLERPRGKRDTTEAVKVRLATVTPEMANEWLSREDQVNRSLSVGVVNAYARLMAGGQWTLNGDTIVISSEGKLLNGQHRLRALIKAGIPVLMIVVDGVDPSAIDTMDDGRRRSVSDNLHISGTPMPAAASSGARWLLRLKLEAISRNQRVTNHEVIQLLQKHPGLAISAKRLDQADIFIGLMPSIFTALHYIGGVLLEKPAEAEAFFQVLSTGTPAYDGDPVHALREKLIKHQKQGANLNSMMQWNGAVHAWNLFCTKTPVKKLQIPEETVIEGLDISKI